MIELVQERGGLPPQLFRKRPLLKFALAKNESLLADALLDEQKRERAARSAILDAVEKRTRMLRHARVSQLKR